jgi:hypothetical protein
VRKHNFSRSGTLMPAAIAEYKALLTCAIPDKRITA